MTDAPASLEQREYLLQQLAELGRAVQELDQIPPSMRKFQVMADMHADMQALIRWFAVRKQGYSDCRIVSRFVLVDAAGGLIPENLPPLQHGASERP